MFFGNKIIKVIIYCILVFCLLGLCGCYRNGVQNFFGNSIPDTTVNRPTATPYQDKSQILENVESGTDVDYSDFDKQDDDIIQDSIIRVVLDSENTYVDSDSDQGISIDHSDNKCVVSITRGGEYFLTGTLNNGQIYVAAGENQVRLILNGVSIHCADSAPIYLNNGKKTVITLAEGSVNTLTDGSVYNYSVTKTDEETGEVKYEPNGALFSKKSLTINGSGSLVIDGNCNNGISCKDELKIIDATISVEAANNGIKGNDFVTIQNGNITVVSNGDGIKSDKDDDALKGFISIESGSVTVTAKEDGLQAVTTVAVYGGNININASGKGIQSDNAMLIARGLVNITSTDDSLHANDFIDIVDGDITLATQDDGVHADNTINIKGGKINITKSYEGIEAACIIVDGGEINLVASDDGFNASNGSGGGFGGGMFPGGMRPRSSYPQEASSSVNDCSITINGGYIYINASGDGIDSNGGIEINGGTTIVNGPTNSGNGALDSGDGGYEIIVNGGTLIAAGASGMAEVPSSGSKQCILSINVSTSQNDIAILDSEGNVIILFEAVKQYQSVIVSCADFVQGQSYSIYSRPATGSDNGTLIGTVKISSIITTVGNSSGGMGPGGMGPGSRPGRW